MGSTVNELCNLGLPPELAAQLGADANQSSLLPLSGTPTLNLGSASKQWLSVYSKYLNPSAAAGVTAAGTTIADALQLAATVNNVTTAAANTGVKLVDNGAGTLMVVRNGGANDLKVYPPNGSSAINGGSAGAAVTLTTLNKQIGVFYQVSATLWIGLVATAT